MSHQNYSYTINSTGPGKVQAAGTDHSMVVLLLVFIVDLGEDGKTEKWRDEVGRAILFRPVLRFLPVQRTYPADSAYSTLCRPVILALGAAANPCMYTPPPFLL